MERFTMKVKKLEADAKIPSKREGDSGYDLYAAPSFKGKLLLPGDIILIPTGIAVSVPTGYGFILKERGSTGTKGLALRCGIVDSLYTGNIFVCLNNTSNKNIFIGSPEEANEVSDSFIFYDKSKAIAQGLIIETKHMDIIEVDQLEATERGEGKLGSSGK